MEKIQPDPDQSRLEALLKLTSDRLGTTPEALKQAARNGDLSQVAGGQSETLQKVLSDPEAAKKLLSTPQAQKLLQLLGKKDT